MDLAGLAAAAGRKGLDLVGTGDFTHPAWLDELRAALRPDGDGVYRFDGARFLVTGEVCVIWRQDGRGRRVHLLLMLPSFDDAERVRRALSVRGNLAADGRPMLGMSAVDLCDLVWTEAPETLIVPAHAWTPWYAVFGAKSGFDDLEACFGGYAARIPAIETGLSSDPPMNRRVSGLDRLALISNSDAHSPEKLGREATVFDLPELSYLAIAEAIRTRDGLVGTVEFHPEHGKYHSDGHRACNVSMSPREAMAIDNACPVCGKPLTVGVLHRIEKLADRSEADAASRTEPYRSVVPLDQLIAQALDVGPGTKTVARLLDRLIERFGGELGILLDRPLDELAADCPDRIVEAIGKARAGEVLIVPGYDGVYGRVEIPLD